MVLKSMWHWVQQPVDCLVFYLAVCWEETLVVCWVDDWDETQAVHLVLKPAGCLVGSLVLDLVASWVGYLVVSLVVHLVCYWAGCLVSWMGVHLDLSSVECLV